MYVYTKKKNEKAARLGIEIIPILPPNLNKLTYSNEYKIKFPQASA